MWLHAWSHQLHAPRMRDHASWQASCSHPDQRLKVQVQPASLSRHPSPPHEQMSNLVPSPGSPRSRGRSRSCDALPLLPPPALPCQHAQDHGGALALLLRPAAALRGVPLPLPAVSWGQHDSAQHLRAESRRQILVCCPASSSAAPAGRGCYSPCCPRRAVRLLLALSSQATSTATPRATLPSPDAALVPWRTTLCSCGASLLISLPSVPRCREYQR